MNIFFCVSIHFIDKMWNAGERRVSVKSKHYATLVKPNLLILPPVLTGSQVVIFRVDDGQIHVLGSVKCHGNIDDGVIHTRI